MFFKKKKHKTATIQRIQNIYNNPFRFGIFLTFNNFFMQYTQYKKLIAVTLNNHKYSILIALKNQRRHFNKLKFKCDIARQARPT